MCALSNQPWILQADFKFYNTIFAYVSKNIRHFL